MVATVATDTLDWTDTATKERNLLEELQALLKVVSINAI
jgi:hypothetical protein